MSPARQLAELGLRQLVEGLWDGLESLWTLGLHVCTSTAYMYCRNSRQSHVYTRMTGWGRRDRRCVHQHSLCPGDCHRQQDSYHGDYPLDGKCLRTMIDFIIASVEETAPWRQGCPIPRTGAFLYALGDPSRSHRLHTSTVAGISAQCPYFLWHVQRLSAGRDSVRCPLYNRLPWCGSCQTTRCPRAACGL